MNDCLVSDPTFHVSILCTFGEHEVSIDRNDIQDMSFITIWSDTSTCSKEGILKYFIEHYAVVPTKIRVLLLLSSTCA